MSCMFRPYCGPHCRKRGSRGHYCKSICNSWIHNVQAYHKLVLWTRWWSVLLPGTLPADYPTITGARAKVNCDILSKEILSLKTSLSHTQEVASPREFPSEDTQLTSKVAFSSSSVTSSQKHLTSTKKKPTKPEAITWEDRKFNVVIYGIEECTKGTPRHTRLNHDFVKI